VARIGQRSFGTKEVGDLADLVVRGGPHVLSLWPAVSSVAKAAGRAPSREERESCGRSLGDTSPSAVLVADGQSWVNPSFLSCYGAGTVAHPAGGTKRLAATSRTKTRCHLGPATECGEKEPLAAMRSGHDTISTWTTSLDDASNRSSTNRYEPSKNGDGGKVLEISVASDPEAP
jgi:hypothetical protein